ncbi:unnamed protein product [Rotaria magnacalcarata]|uniref:Claudin n=1 Tax=Rotaria magnacalcarata TaxID=392030 RepID=A0A816S6D0_9BILA|nr:unnamed protein product [Rotaria magnacalcarata]CAF1594585.1 unnamed protein product [Rotaria magnacalcarata]CAF1988991.1 unnamed protein product [Rotaria magnacalcarata]CAF2069785.1 unnamed protein product [Rotaria magnacalcarata]CAF2081771.1 unnamed protein product [Rotaria magnacalcarata]
MISNKRALSIAAATLLIVACVIYVASVATPLWGTQQYLASYQITLGLWNYCVGSICADIGSSCDTTLSDCSKLLAARAFMILACVIPAFTVTILAVMVIKDQYDRPLIYASIAIAWLSTACGLIGMVIGIYLALNAASLSLGASGIIAIVGVSINFIGAALTSALALL